VKSSLFGVLGVAVPNMIYGRASRDPELQEGDNKELFHRYPSIDDDIVEEVVGVSHFDLDSLKELVDRRPELSRATWDWGFGDWETAIGAASHVGRPDIVKYLLSKGARPDLFTFAMLGQLETVKAMIEASPGIQSIEGPHGISLLDHVRAGQRWKDRTGEQKDQGERLIAYLEELGDAGSHREYPDMDPAEKQKYLGDYMYGAGPDDGFSIKLNMRDLLSFGRLGKFGGALYQTGENTFKYNGTSSVKITFSKEDGKVRSLTIHEPGLTLTARKAAG